MNHAYDTDPLFNIPQDYPPERSAWDAANGIREYIEHRGEDLSADELEALYKALNILQEVCK